MRARNAGDDRRAHSRSTDGFPGSARSRSTTTGSAAGGLSQHAFRGRLYCTGATRDRVVLA